MGFHSASRVEEAGVGGKGLPKLYLQYREASPTVAQTWDHSGGWSGRRGFVISADRGDISQEGIRCGKGPQVGSPRAPRNGDASKDDTTLAL